MLSLILASLGAIVAIPVFYVARIYFRIFWYGAEIRFNPAMSVIIQIPFPFIAYKNMVLPYNYFPRVLELETFEIRPDDIYITGFVRSGTTWAQELVYLIVNGADTNKALSATSHRRVPTLEDVFEFDLESFNRRPSPRLFKTHLHYPLLPPQVDSKRPKIIYLMRNPKDVCLSFFRLLRIMKVSVKDDFDLFLDVFISSKLAYTSWSNNLKGFWNKRHQENILILKYEDMIQDVDGVVRKLASFLEKTLTDEQVTAIVQHCSFNKMKYNDKANGSWLETSGFVNNIGTKFIRKGKVGDWKQHYTPEQSMRMDKMVEETLAGTGIEFTYDLNGTTSQIAVRIGL